MFVHTKHPYVCYNGFPLLCQEVLLFFRLFKLFFTIISILWKFYIIASIIARISFPIFSDFSSASARETPLGKPRMALQAYMPALQGVGHKASAQQIQECGGILSVLLQEKKEESFKDKNA